MMNLYLFNLKFSENGEIIVNKDSESSHLVYLFEHKLLQKDFSMLSIEIKCYFDRPAEENSLAFLMAPFNSEIISSFICREIKH
ncbi:hypothetical protein BpHYR1_050781 [Brachionus plicatilis]|uniref:Uncharacterized protein n=1 Tax=Brachionus plicatilis TaxID=10195 RepID=A0A3M7PXD8_BRAPC|nr:hypothetical protein BpHYR1_050781 [Brachionus plicatilis]